jgi:hypothetical protein
VTASPRRATAATNADLAPQSDETISSAVGTHDACSAMTMRKSGDHATTRLPCIPVTTRISDFAVARPAQRGKQGHLCHAGGVACACRGRRLLPGTAEGFASWATIEA